MLSRIAEALFWIGRYLERADDTARILDVHLHALIEDPYASEPDACSGLLQVMGLPVPDQGVDRDLVLGALAWDAVSPTAIVGAVGAARENARRAREIVSSDLWEGLNTTWLGLPEARERAASPHLFFRWVRERTALVAGIADASMSRDDAWRFLVLGRSLERADITARLVAMRAVPGGAGSWRTILRSCGAYESYVRTYRGLASDEAAAEFLLLDRLFPRSVLHALMRAEECLGDLTPAQERAGVSDLGRRELGRARAALEFRQVDEVLADLPAQMQRVQHACAATSAAVSRRFFPEVASTSWTEEV
ncbi:MAG TPA: alpha-E domain-containing protein [Kineosporiaceae bacterium]|nr:alpha-E domain-containing protein [Kineosporiaceae bacterium]